MIRTDYPELGEKVWRETLPCGLKVAVAARPGFTRKIAYFVTDYGSVHTDFTLEGQTFRAPEGVAHFLEHKMFDLPGRDVSAEFAAMGASVNAFTSYDVTAYYFTCTERFADCLHLLLEFVSTPYFTAESVEKEQGIIGQEIGMIEDNPEWQVYKRLMQALYRTSPARVSVAGSVESISHITAQTLYDCHKAFYTPANMCLVVVGDLEPDAVFSLAEEVLPKESGPTIPRDYGEEKELTPLEAETSCQMEIAMPTFLLGFKCPPMSGGQEQMRRTLIGELACDVLLGDSSPLYARLYSQGLINGTFGYSFDTLPGVAYAYIGGDSKDPHAVAELVLQEVQRLVREGIDADYFGRILRANYGSTLKSLNSFESIAISLVEGCFEGYDPLLFPEMYDSITQEDLLTFMRENLCREHMTLSVVYPKE